MVKSILQFLGVINSPNLQLLFILTWSTDTTWWFVSLAYISRSVTKTQNGYGGAPVMVSITIMSSWFEYTLHLASEFCALSLSKLLYIKSITLTILTNLKFFFLIKIIGMIHITFIWNGAKRPDAKPPGANTYRGKTTTPPSDVSLHDLFASVTFLHSSSFYIRVRSFCSVYRSFCYRVFLFCIQLFISWLRPLVLQRSPFVL